MSNPQNSLQGNADSKQLISQLLTNVSALSEALNKEDNVKDQDLLINVSKKNAQILLRVKVEDTGKMEA